MGRWISMTAVFGLVCLMIIPTPGISGICIGAVCLLAIIATAVMHLLDRASTYLLLWHDSYKQQRIGNRRRNLHAQSGMARKA